MLKLEFAFVLVFRDNSSFGLNSLGNVFFYIYKSTERPVVLLNAIFYEESRWAEAYIGCWKFQLAQIYN